MLRALVKRLSSRSTAGNEASFWFGKSHARRPAAHQARRVLPEGREPSAAGARDRPVNRSRQATGGTAGSVRHSAVWSNRLTTRAGVSYNDKRREGRERGRRGAGHARVSTGTHRVRRTACRQRPARQHRRTRILSRLTQPNEKLTVSFDTTVFARRDRRPTSCRPASSPSAACRGITWYTRMAGSRSRSSVLRSRASMAAARPVPPARHERAGADDVQTDGGAISRSTSRTHGGLVAADDQRGVRVDQHRGQGSGVRRAVAAEPEVGPRFGVNYALTPTAATSRARTGSASTISQGSSPPLVIPASASATCTTSISTARSKPCSSHRRRQRTIANRTIDPEPAPALRAGVGRRIRPTQLSAA